MAGLVAFGVLVMLLLFRPTGILGEQLGREHDLDRPGDRDPPGPEAHRRTGTSCALDTTCEPRHQPDCATSRRVLVAALVLAVMTGPPGNNAAPTSGFTGSLQFPRLLWFLGFGAGLFAIVTIWHTLGGAASSRADRLRSSIFKLTARRRARLAIDLAIVAFGFIWFPGSHRTTRGRAASASRSVARSRRWTW